MNFKRIARERAGTFLFVSLGLFGTARVLHQAVPGHYRIFTAAAAALWSGQNPHGTDFGTGVGYWFYSPSCGLFFFRLFGLFPETIGILLYSVLSIAALYFGLARFCGAVARAEPPAALREWSLALLSPLLLLAVTASKPEVLMTGVLLAAMAELFRGRRFVIATATLAMILNWKFQPLPSLGLVSIAWWSSRRDAKLPLALGAWTLAWFALPLAVIPLAGLLEIHSTWASTLEPFVASSWMNFDNVFSFAVHGLGVAPDYAAARLFSVLVGAALAGAILERSRRSRDFTDLAFFAVATGAAYTATLSPLSQNNSYVLLAPLYVFALRAASRSIRAPERSHGIAIAFGSLQAIFLLAYSDLMPVVARAALRAVATKSIALFVFTIALVWLERSESIRLSEPLPRT